jgi:hypothetical protein
MCWRVVVLSFTPKNGKWKKSFIFKKKNKGGECTARSTRVWRRDHIALALFFLSLSSVHIKRVAHQTVMASFFLRLLLLLLLFISSLSNTNYGIIIIFSLKFPRRFFRGNFLELGTHVLHPLTDYSSVATLLCLKIFVANSAPLERRIL